MELLTLKNKDVRILLLCLCVFASGAVISSDSGNRTKRFFPFFTIITFDNGPCETSQNDTGMCLTSSKCDRTGGSPAGSCAQNYGVCCVFNLTCGHSTNQNVSYFTNAGYPELVDAASVHQVDASCVFTVNKSNDDICQIRLDFEEFNLAPPQRSVCEKEYLELPANITGPICGLNTGQHVYLDVGSDDFVDVSVIVTSDDETTNNNNKSEATWKIKATQIACNSHMRAPEGCLQYHSGKSGEVKSFNYGGGPDDDTRHLANQDYTICVKKESNACSVKWEAADETGFDVAGSLGTSTTRPAEDQCYQDYVTIPGHSADGNEPTADRQCGQRLNPTDNVATNSPVISKLNQFMLRFHTDSSEANGEVNAGFALKYEQQDCS